ncbi:MAG: helix-turn-helix transcriptional regulator [Clostridia bacterium]|nr:helix-turn-helix transcriptional regulator [Clostridia bacterium]
MEIFLTDFGTTFRMEHFSGLSVMRYAHIHAQYELYFCTEDVEQRSVINGVEYVYQYPCVILSPPYTVHSMSCTDTRAVDFDRYVFYFDEEMLSSYKTELIPSALRQMGEGRIFRLSQDQAEYLKRLLVWCEEQPDEISKNTKELTCVLFLNKLFEICSEGQTTKVEGSPSYIQEVRRYVVEHFCEPLDIQNLARLFSVSRSKLDRDFKKYTGITVHDFLESCRINQAKRLLQSRKVYSIFEIATRCGFDSESYFFPFFKRHTGLTPSEFRNEYRKVSDHESKPSCGNNKKKEGEQNGKDYLYGCGEHSIC